MYNSWAVVILRTKYFSKYIYERYFTELDQDNGIELRTICTLRAIYLPLFRGIFQ